MVIANDDLHAKVYPRGHVSGRDGSERRGDWSGRTFQDLILAGEGNKTKTCVLRYLRNPANKMEHYEKFTRSLQQGEHLFQAHPFTATVSGITIIHNEGWAKGSAGRKPRTYEVAYKCSNLSISMRILLPPRTRAISELEESDFIAQSRSTFIKAPMTLLWDYFSMFPQFHQQLMRNVHSLVQIIIHMPHPPFHHHVIAHSLIFNARRPRRRRHLHRRWSSLE